MEFKTNKSYLDEFLNLKSVGDILNIIAPIGNSPHKEITESMSIIHQVRKVVLKSPMKYTLWDFCAGNALTSVIAVHLLPIEKAIAVDQRKRSRRWFLAKRFEYRFEDIFEFDPSTIEEDSIIIGIHACQDLSERIIKIFNSSRAEYLFLMPCCIGQIKEQLPTALHLKLTKPERWTYSLYTKVKGSKDIVQDKKVISPHNLIIKSRR